MNHDGEPKDSYERFEKAVEGARHAKYNLRLFVAGNTVNSAKAIETIRDICEKQLEGRYILEVVDIYQQPELARKEQILATPTLIKTLPPPLRRIIGNLSSEERILIGLDLNPVHDTTGSSPHADNGDAKG